jgi:phage shock protein C
MAHGTQHRLRRSKRDRIIGGVCGGLGEFFGLNPWIFRIIFLILIPTGPPAVLPYILMWILIPPEEG